MMRLRNFSVLYWCPLCFLFGFRNQVFFLRMLSGYFGYPWCWVLVKMVSWFIASLKLYHSNGFIFYLGCMVYDKNWEDLEDPMSEAYLATFSPGMSKMYPVTCTFRSLELRSVSKLYLASFDPCTYKCHLIMFRLNLEIYSIIFLSFQSFLKEHLHSCFLSPFIDVGFWVSLTLIRLL